MLNYTYFCSDMLLELARREKIAGIKPDEDLDIFMKVITMIRCVCFGVFFFLPDSLLLLRLLII
jgi:hypothetical protein